MSYPLKFRLHVLSVRKKEGLSIKQTAKRFDIGTSSVKRWLSRVEPKETRNRPATKIDMEALKQDLEDYPDAYLTERAARLNVGRSTVFDAIRRLGMSYEKNDKSSKGRWVSTEALPETE